MQQPPLFLDLRPVFGEVVQPALVNKAEILFVNRDNSDNPFSGKKNYSLIICMKDPNAALTRYYDRETERDAAYEKVAARLL